jgi:3-hydroxyisobutyrate dehydrogenase
MTNSITYIGAGLMGSGMIRTLLGKGYEVSAYDLSQQALERVREYGASPIHSLDEALGMNKFILLSLPGPAQVNEVVAKIATLRQGESDLVVIDFSTIDPQTAIQSAAVLKAAGIQHVEAPVSGGPKGANAGTLSIMIGTEESTYAQAQHILEAVGGNLYYLGVTGTAALAKLCNNVVVAGTTAILGEAFALAAAGGIAPQQLKDVLSQSVGGSNTLELFGKHMTSGDYSEPTFALSLMYKDLGLFMDAAKHYKVTSMLGTMTYQLYNGAHLQGWNNQDHSVVCRLLEMMNNTSTTEQK